MRLKRLIRDSVVLLLFCGAFYLLTPVLGRLENKTVADSDFSRERKRADDSLQDQDWKAASADYLALAEKDPFNGHAWYRCGMALNFQRQDIFRQIQEARTDAQNARENSGSEHENSKKIELLKNLEAELDQLSEKAKSALKRAKEFIRYRADSLLELAAIESYEGNNNASLGYLEEFVDNGSYTQRGLAYYRVFGMSGPTFESPTQGLTPQQIRLHAEPKFWEIVRKESLNHSP